MRFDNCRPCRSRRTKRVRWRFGLALMILGVATLTTLAQPELDYQRRENRYEGIKRKAVSGYDIELLGAMIELSQSSREFPETATVRFFLKRQEAVHLTIRERFPDTFYWLDRVQPSGWRPQTTNIFSWPSREVLRPLGLRPSDLVALIRLGDDSPGRRERVAPVAFPEMGGPLRIDSYRFTFKTNASAKVQHRVLGADSRQVLNPELERRTSADTAFDIRWDARDQPEGYYVLRVEGYFLTDNTRILQEVEFFHSSVWPP